MRGGVLNESAAFLMRVAPLSDAIQMKSGEISAWGRCAAMRHGGSNHCKCRICGTGESTLSNRIPYQ